MAPNLLLLVILVVGYGAIGLLTTLIMVTTTLISLEANPQDKKTEAIGVQGMINMFFGWPVFLPFMTIMFAYGLAKLAEERKGKSSRGRI